MMLRISSRVLIAAILMTALNGVASAQTPMGTAFTYQGQLKNGIAAVNDPAMSMSFSLYDSATGGNPVGNPNAIAKSVAVTNGQFTTSLDFGVAVGNGQARWLEIEVNNSTLSPRQALTPVPAALFSAAPWTTSGANIAYNGGLVGIGASPDTLHSALQVVPAAYGVASGHGIFLGADGIGKTQLAIDLSGYSFGFATLQSVAAAGLGYGNLELNPLGGNVGIGQGGVESNASLQVAPNYYGTAAGRGILLGRDITGKTQLALDLSDEANGHASIQAVKAAGSLYGDLALNPVGGKVGIGTDTPGFPLSFANSVGDKIALWGQTGAHYGFGIQSSLLQIHTPNSSSDIAFGYGSSASFIETMRIRGDGQLVLATPGTTPRVNVTNISGIAIQGTGKEGVTGMATQGPNNVGVHGVGNLLGQRAGLFDGNVWVNGTLCATDGVGTCSDARFKEHITPIGGALKTIEALRGVEYDWKRDAFPERRFSDERQVGFIAQDVKSVLPQVVHTDSDGYLSVDYGRLTPVLVESIKELKQQNDELKERIRKLESMAASPR